MSELDPTQIDPIIESILFVADGPLTVEKIAEVLKACGHEEVLTADVIAAFERLRGKYSGPNGLRIDEVAGGIMLRTNPDNAPYILKYLNAKPEKLSRSALETLAITAYRQPVTKTEIDEIRGIDSGALLRRLLEKGLIRIRGRKNVIGKPYLYGTSQYFLEVFGINQLGDLPEIGGLVPGREFRLAEGQGILPLDIEHGETDEQQEILYEVKPDSEHDSVGEKDETVAVTGSDEDEENENE